MPRIFFLAYSGLSEVNKRHFVHDLDGWLKLLAMFLYMGSWWRTKAKANLYHLSVISAGWCRRRVGSTPPKTPASSTPGSCIIYDFLEEVTYHWRFPFVLTIFTTALKFPVGVCFPQFVFNSCSWQHPQHQQRNKGWYNLINQTPPLY